MSGTLPDDWVPPEHTIRGVLLLLSRAHLKLDDMGVPPARPRPEPLERTTW